MIAQYNTTLAAQHIVTLLREAEENGQFLSQNGNSLQQGLFQ
jgi:hypothetical protein